MNHAAMKDLDAQFWRFTINGKEREYSSLVWLPFTLIVALAFPDAQDGADYPSPYIVKYKGRNKKGQVHWGETVEKEEGMTIKVYKKKGKK